MLFFFTINRPNKPNKNKHLPPPLPMQKMKLQSKKQMLIVEIWTEPQQIWDFISGSQRSIHSTSGLEGCLIRDKICFLIYFLFLHLWWSSNYLKCFSPSWFSLGLKLLLYIPLVITDERSRTAPFCPLGGDSSHDSGRRSPYFNSRIITKLNS